MKYPGTHVSRNTISSAKAEVTETKHNLKFIRFIQALKFQITKPEESCSWKILVCAVIGFAIPATPLIAQGQDSDKIYVKEFKAAKAKESACIFQKDKKACKEMFAAYDRAASAPDADNSVRHYVFKHRLQAQAERIEEIAGSYYSQDYVIELQEAYKELLSHYEGGKHKHAIIEHLRLQTQLADQLFFQEQFAEGDRVLLLMRETAEKYWNERTKFETYPNLKALFQQLLIDMPRAEKALAEQLSERATYQIRVGKEDTHERAISAWQNFERWVHRQAETGVHHPMDRRWELEIAEANFKLGFLYKNVDYSNRNEEESKRRFETAAVLSCALLDPEQAKALGINPAKAHEMNTAQDLCERAMLMLSGKLEQMAKESAEQMIKQQMEILKSGKN